MDFFPYIYPLLKKIDGEKAHRLTINALRLRPGTLKPHKYPQSLSVKSFGLEFPNPLGLAAGFDKDAEIIKSIFSLDFGFAEIGGVTPLPQSGNARPRVFRLPQDGAIINRYGLNSAGLDIVRARLAQRNRRTGIIGVNIGANKDSADRTADYVKLVKGLSDVSDYISVNISSPNTPGLRDLQGKIALDSLLAQIMDVKTTCPILIKIAPDLELQDLDDIIDLGKKYHIDGLIIANTTIARPQSLIHKKQAVETGGLSGRPVFGKSTWVLAQAFQRVEGRFPLIGVGGIDSVETAWTKIRAGATLLQLYTALVYKGPALIGTILNGLAVKLEQNGFNAIQQAVGLDAKKLSDSAQYNQQ